MRISYHPWILSVCFIVLGLTGSLNAQQVASAPSVPLIQPEELSEIQSDGDVIVLDTRSLQEYQEGHLKNARFVDFDTFDLGDVADISKDQKIVVYCKVGGRSHQVAAQLIEAGYKRVKSLEGGITKWKAQGYEITND